MTIDVPQDRNSTFEPKAGKKRQKDISDIDQKIISMYAKGMTMRQKSETLQDIYGFEVSEYPLLTWGKEDLYLEITDIYPIRTIVLLDENDL